MAKEITLRQAVSALFDYSIGEPDEKFESQLAEAFIQIDNYFKSKNKKFRGMTQEAVLKNLLRERLLNTTQINKLKSQKRKLAHISRLRKQHHINGEQSFNELEKQVFKTLQKHGVNAALRLIPDEYKPQETNNSHTNLSKQVLEKIVRTAKLENEALRRTSAWKENLALHRMKKRQR